MHVSARSLFFLILGLTLNTLAWGKRPATHLKSLCDVSHDNVSLFIPSNINDGQAKPLLAPIADHPKFVVIAVGVANYTCLHDGTWKVYGAMMELFDVSCVPQHDRAAFTKAVYDLWIHAPSDMSALHLVEMSGRALQPFAMGQHYWVPNPLNETDGTTNPKWDFGSHAWHDILAHAEDPESAYLIGYRTGIVPAPVDPEVNIEWVTLAPLLRNGQPLGHFAKQVFRINTYGGFAPSATCDPKGPIGQAKTVLNFWYY